MDSAKNIGDRYEITRVESYPLNVTLGDRVLYLHNNKIAQSLQLNGSYGDTVEELAGLNGETLVACAPRLFGSGECERLISEILNIDFMDSKCTPEYTHLSLKCASQFKRVPIADHTLKWPLWRSWV